MIILPQFVATVFFFFWIDLVQGNGLRLYGINYSSRKGPDWDPNRCKTESEILEDLQAIKTITSRVRIYSLQDCDQGKPILKLAKKVGLQVWIGLWLSKDADYGNEKKGLQELISLGLLDSNVLGIHVGSEGIYRGDYTSKQAIAAMNDIKTFLRSNNIKLPITISDIGDIYSQYTELFDAVEVVSVNAFPFWEKKSAETAVEYLVDRLSTTVLDKVKGKPFILSETGWASNGANINASVASPENQFVYFSKFVCAAIQHKWDYYYFAAFDDSWKIVDEVNDVEGHFGIFYANRTIKPWFKQSFTCSGSTTTGVSNNTTPADVDGAKAKGTNKGTVFNLFDSVQDKEDALKGNNDLSSHSHVSSFSSGLILVILAFWNFFNFFDN